MSIHRADRPDRPVRVRKSSLNPHVWLWCCWERGTTSSRHSGRGYPTQGDAWAAMEKHRRTEHGGTP